MLSLWKIQNSDSFSTSENMKLVSLLQCIESLWILKQFESFAFSLSAMFEHFMSIQTAIGDVVNN